VSSTHHKLAVSCVFVARTDEMIRDNIIENWLSPRIRERLLLDTDLTLDRAVMTASQIESAADQAKSISNSHQVTAASSKTQNNGKPSQIKYV